MDDAVFIEVQRLCRTAHMGGLQELAVSRPGFSLALKCVPSGSAVFAPQIVAQIPCVEEKAAEETIGHAVGSPLTGIFYRSASPGAPPLVEVGDRIEQGQIICVVEAMKVFNEITADCAGTILTIPAENGQMVQTGQALVTVDTEN